MINVNIHATSFESSIEKDGETYYLNLLTAIDEAFDDIAEWHEDDRVIEDVFVQRVNNDGLDYWKVELLGNGYPYHKSVGGIFNREQLDTILFVYNRTVENEDMITKIKLYGNMASEIKNSVQNYTTEFRTQFDYDYEDMGEPGFVTRPYFDHYEYEYL